MKLDDKLLREAVRAADRRYYDLVQRMAAQHREDTAARKGRRIMKKIGKFAIGIAATAVLFVGGGIAATVAMRGHNGGYHDYSSEIQSMLDSAKSSSSPQSESSSAGTVIVPLDLPLTDQQDEPSMRRQSSQQSYLDPYGYAASDAGWYFTESGVGVNGKDVDPIWYSDIDTGACVVFCARPNCLHDGNEYCTATTSAYVRLSAPVWLDGYVYALAKKPYGKNLSAYAAMGGDDTAGSVVLLRYEPDGSEITEIAELRPKTEEYVTIGMNSADLIAHRGQLWYSFSGQMIDHQTTAVTEYYSMGVYSPQKNTAAALLTDEAPMTSSFGQRGAPINLVGDGDYVYFKYDAAGRWDDGNKLRSGIWRISCVTGALEKAYTLDSHNLLERYCVLGDKIVMQYQVAQGTQNSVTVYGEIRVYSISADEEKVLLNTQEIADHPTLSSLCADDAHIYCSVNNALWILDYDGNVQEPEVPSDLEWKYYGERLHEVMPALEAGTNTVSLAGWGLMLHDGKLYRQYMLSWFSMPVSDVLRGATNWQPAFSHDNWR